MPKKKQHEEEHVDEGWLIPYSDILTLLLALFIVMFATSQVDQQRFEEMKKSFNEVFSGGAGVTITDPATSLIKFDNTLAAKAEAKKMDEIIKKLNNEIEKSGYSKYIKTRIYKEGLEISIQDTVLFDSGDSIIRSNVTPILSVVAKILQDIGNDIKVIGNTDNVPINNAKFHSNWDLSASRAINVMNYLVKTGNLESKRFVIQGNGEHKPRFDNSTEEGRAKNRRVDIVILRKFPMPLPLPSENDNQVILKSGTEPVILKDANKLEN